MSLVSEAKRIEIGQKLEQWKTSIINHLNECDNFFGKLVDAKATCSDDAAEIDTFIDAAKAKLNEIINKYKS